MGSSESQAPLEALSSDHILPGPSSADWGFHFIPQR